MEEVIRKLKILLKLMVYKLFSKRTSLLDDEAYNKLIFFITFGRIPDFDNPKTFNEYIVARKVRRDEYDLWKYTDKYEVRSYVKDTVGEKYLNECFGVFERFSDININVLPRQFALRGTHGSGYNIIVSDKNNFDKTKAKKKFDKWLEENFYYLGREKNYFKIKPRIMCDRYLKCNTCEGLPELKLFCFNGKVKLISYNMIIDGKTYSNMYDGSWNRIEMKRGYKHFDNAKIPENHMEIIEVAEKLSEQFDFVRVDLYNVDNRVIFSELTFHSGGGFVPFSPTHYDIEYAEFFEELEKPV